MKDPSADETVLFSVIVPAYQAERTLDACLEAVSHELRAHPDIASEIIVVDDGSSDNTAAIASDHDCRLIRLSENRGAAAARNAGFQQARGRFVWFVDADGILRAGALAKVSEAFEGDGIDAVFGIFAKEQSKRNFPSQYKLHLLRSYFLRIGRQTRGICTAVCALRLEALESVGGFDERIKGASVEDVELGERLVSKGYRIAFNPKIEVEHRKHYTWQSLAATQFHKAYSMGRLFYEKSGLRETIRTGYFFLVPLWFGMSLILAPLALLFLGATVFFGPGSLIPAGLLYAVMISSHFTFLRRMFAENGLAYTGAAAVVLPIDFTLGAFSAALGWASACFADARRRSSIRTQSSG